MKINEIFESIQGEGKYIGQCVLFIRVSGCTRNCDFCDTKYHNQGKEINIKQIIQKIKGSNLDIIVWTGGEPMLQYDEIKKIINGTPFQEHHLETNGDILPPLDSAHGLTSFTYICFSPKITLSAINVKNIFGNTQYDIKIVTDLKLNKELIPYATMLMPLTTYNDKKDKQIQKDVWKYCVKNNIKYTPRIQVDIWGSKKGV